MNRPVDLPPAERHAHGTRARYVAAKCRCAPCKESNRLYYHKRQRRGRELAAQLAPAPTRPILGRDGRPHERACPGVNGQPCSIGAYLRKDSMAVCRACRDRLSFNGLVDAARARKHLRYLSRAGVGRDAVSAAGDVAVTVLSEVFRGEKLRIRVETERRILEVSAGARADHALVPAAPSWRLIGKLLERGFTRGDIAHALGRETPSLQLRRGRILARTALEVRRLYKAASDPPEHGTRWRPKFCDCIASAPRGGRCRTCRGILRPDGMTEALLAGGSEKTKAVHRAFGFDGGWGIDQRQSNRAKKAEQRELRQLARVRVNETMRSVNVGASR
jgi:hypothetical protein